MGAINLYEILKSIYASGEEYTVLELLDALIEAIKAYPAVTTTIEPNAETTTESPDMLSLGINGTNFTIRKDLEDLIEKLSAVVPTDIQATESTEAENRYVLQLMHDGTALSGQTPANIDVGSDVMANPDGSATDTLEKIYIDGIIYSFPTVDLSTYVTQDFLTMTLDNYYTKTQVDSTLGKYLPLSGGTMTGDITTSGTFRNSTYPVSLFGFDGDAPVITAWVNTFKINYHEGNTDISTSYLINRGGYGIYNLYLPSSSGTLALTSDLSDYLPKEGGDITGTLFFSGDRTSLYTARMAQLEGHALYCWLTTTENWVAGIYFNGTSSSSSELTPVGYVDLGNTSSPYNNVYLRNIYQNGIAYDLSTFRTKSDVISGTIDVNGEVHSSTGGGTWTIGTGLSANEVFILSTDITIPAYSKFNVTQLVQGFNRGYSKTFVFSNNEDTTVREWFLQTNFYIENNTAYLFYTLVRWDGDEYSNIANVTFEHSINLIN